MLVTPAAAGEILTLVTTTSTDHSGLMATLLPAYKAKTGIDVRAVVAPTGKALRLARAGDADILIAHDRDAELQLVENGLTSYRKTLMFNDFVIVGPPSDPAKIDNAPSAPVAFARIAQARALFASRGDDSGTHRRETALWNASRAMVGDWLRETGAGQGPTLNFAAAQDAYALTDRGTWLFFENRGDLVVLFEGDTLLRNYYGVSLINPDRHDHINADAANAFIDWLTGPEGQTLIASHHIEGVQAFHPASHLTTD